MPTEFRAVEFEEESMRAYLRKITTGEIECGVITLPMPDGTEIDFEIHKSESLKDEIIKENRFVVALKGQRTNTGRERVRIGYNARGFSATIRSVNFGTIEFMQLGDYVISFYKGSALHLKPKMKCGVDGDKLSKGEEEKVIREMIKGIEEKKKINKPD